MKYDITRKREKEKEQVINVLERERPNHEERKWKKKVSIEWNLFFKKWTKGFFFLKIAFDRKINFSRLFITNEDRKKGISENCL